MRTITKTRKATKTRDKATGSIVYNNQMDAPDDANPTTAISGGSIVIHTKHQADNKCQANSRN